MRALIGNLNALWRRAGETKAYRRASPPLIELAAAHRLLSREEGRLPDTASTARFRRRCVESLQAETRELEAQVAKLEAMAATVKALLARQLETTREVLETGPAILKIRRRFDWAWRPYRLERSGVMGELEMPALTRRLISLCRAVADGVPTELLRAIRALASSNAKLPATVSAGRYRRRCLEVVQSHTRELEAQLAESLSASLELEALIARQLTSTQVAISVAQPPRPLQVLDFSPEILAAILFPLILTGLLLIAMIRGGRATPAAGLVIWPLRLEFDGRWLRIAPRLFGVTCWFPTVVDLVRFGTVSLATDEYFEGKTLKLTSADGELVICRCQADDEMESAAKMLGEWCAIAAAEKCGNAVE